MYNNMGRGFARFQIQTVALPAGTATCYIEQSVGVQNRATYELYIEQAEVTVDDIYPKQAGPGTKVGISLRNVGVDGNGASLTYVYGSDVSDAALAAGTVMPVTKYATRSSGSVPLTSFEFEMTSVAANSGQVVFGVLVAGSPAIAKRFVVNFVKGEPLMKSELTPSESSSVCGRETVTAEFKNTGER